MLKNIIYLSVFFIVMINKMHTPIAIAQETKIKSGDVIEITVFEHQSLNQYVTVSPKGTINFLFLEELLVADLTLQEVQKILVAQLRGYMDQRPLIRVRLAESYPIKVIVLGQVARPGVHTIINISTLQGAIAEAGGFIPGAQIDRIKLIKKGRRSKIINHIVDMEKFYHEGDLSDLPILEDGDTIFVPGVPLTATIKVLGGVEKPGSYNVSFRTNLLDAIYMAGGPTDRANLNKVKVFSPALKTNQQVRVNVNYFLNSENFKNIPLVQPGDIIHVPSKIVTWRNFINLVRDATAIGMLYVIIRWGRRY